MDDKILKIMRYVINSSYRTNVLKAFENKARFPSEIAKKAGIKQNHISNVLKKLKNKGLWILSIQKLKKEDIMY